MTSLRSAKKGMLQYIARLNTLLCLDFEPNYFRGKIDEFSRILEVLKMGQPLLDS